MTGFLVSRLKVGNPDDWFSCVTAQIIVYSSEQIQAQADLQKQQAMTAASLDTQAVTTIVNGNTAPPPPQQKPQDDKPVDIEGFIQEFLKKNQGGFQGHFL